MICSTISANSIFLAMMIIPLITLPKASCVLLLPPPRIAIQNPKDYEARSNLMWTATWALNTLIGMGKTQDWMVHMLGQAVGAYTDATHGMTLSAVSLAYYRFLLPMASVSSNVCCERVADLPRRKSDETIAKEGLAAMEAWMKEIGVALKLGEVGATEAMIDGIADATFILKGGYKVLTKDEVKAILKASF